MDDINSVLYIKLLPHHVHFVQVFNLPSIFRDHQWTSRVSLARVLATVDVASTNVKSTKIHSQY